MLHRFQGVDGEARLLAALRDQALVEHDAAVSAKLKAVLRLAEHGPGDVIITQGGSDNDLVLLLAGEVDVEVNGRVVARRRPGQHVGEMSMIDPAAKRSATVRAREAGTVVARIEEHAFADIADAHPRVWRGIARELGQRLRERGALIRAPNERALVFVGSSVEGLEIARSFQTAFVHDRWTTKLWTDGVFAAGKTPIESLTEALPTIDFGVLVVVGDDITTSRTATAPSPRDNVVFELGLLIGALGRERTFLLRRSEERDLKLPSDLAGVQALEITKGAEVDIAARVGPAARELRAVVKKLGPR
jgi:CRP/FNR family cyclic AMP-dependent transcriptional regulator